MASASLKLRPSLWRTCRVLANRLRLRILRHLLVRSEQSVSDVAQALSLRTSLASEYLRALNARGLLSVRRSGRKAQYRASADPSLPTACQILEAARRTFAEGEKALPELFHLATAFTHPRREEIYRALPPAGLTFQELRSKTRISKEALKRHLRKLVDREFLLSANGTFIPSIPKSPLGRTLAHLVRNG